MSGTTCFGWIGTAVAAVGLAVAPAARGGTLIGSLTDPEQPAEAGCVDILSAWIEQDGGLLTFFIETREAIPTSVPENEHITFLWLVDADNDPATGQPHEQVGSEFNVRAVIAPTGMGGFVDVTSSLPGGGLGTVAVNGTLVQISVGLGQIANPAEFHWACDACHAINNVAVTANHETDAATATTLPYTPPARVTITTPLLMLSVAGQTTGQLEVEVRDEAGNVMPTGDYHLAFTSSSEGVATVDDNGIVTAHAVPDQFNSTPYIHVSADGVSADNAAVIRVTPTDLGVVHRPYLGTHVAYYLPAMIEGVDLDAITTGYQVVYGTDLAYEAQAELMSAVPFGGGRQYLVLDVADDPALVPCGISGNPVRLGWEFGKPIHNSCYIVNVPEHRVPQWWVMFHEIGHNFTWRSWGFGQFCQASETHHWVYSEALASMAGAWSWYRLDRCPRGLTPEILDSIAEGYPNIVPEWRQALIDYQDAGANYAEAGPDVICDILWEMYDDYGPQVWFDLFSTFVPFDQPLPVELVGEADQATWVVAAVSASAGHDLRARFATDYGFPINDERWAELLAAAQARVDARSWEPPAVGDFDCDGDSDWDDYGVLAGCLNGPEEALLPECVKVDADADGDVDLADFAVFQVGFSAE